MYRVPLLHGGTCFTLQLFPLIFPIGCCTISPVYLAQPGLPMTFSTAFALFVVMAMLAAVPGISVLVVSTRAATGGFVQGCYVTLGVVVGDIIFILLAVGGVKLAYAYLTSRAGMSIAATHMQCMNRMAAVIMFGIAVVLCLRAATVLLR